MRSSSCSRRRWRVLSRGALLALLPVATGCATVRATFDMYDMGRDRLSRPQQRLRESMVAGDYATAIAWREDDALLRALNVGIASYYAGAYARSGVVLDSAALLADDRITASVSRNALAMVTNDNARRYQPGRTERLFIPYYGILAYARLGAWEDAAVEARRLSGLLAEYASGRDEDERPLHAAMHHLAGAVFERAGERAEAAVSYRAARALLFPLSDSVAPSGPARQGWGELLVIVERGFVAHRITESVDVNPGEADRDSLHGSYRSIAFPTLRRSAHPRGSAVELTVDDRPMRDNRLVAIVDDATSADERRERAGVATRAIARAAVKYTVTKAIRDKQGETVGTAAEIGAALLERADIRSWHLLPQELTLVSVRLPVGARRVRLRVGSDAKARTVDLGGVAIVGGTTTIVPVRLWSEPPA